MADINLKVGIKKALDACGRKTSDDERQKCSDLVRACEQISTESDPTFYIVNDSGKEKMMKTAESCLGIAPIAVLIYGKDVAIKNANRQLLTGRARSLPLTPVSRPTSSPVIPAATGEVVVPNFRTSKAPRIEPFPDSKTGQMRLAIDGRFVESLRAFASCGNKEEEVHVEKEADNYFYSGILPACEEERSYSIKNVVLLNDADYSKLPYPDPFKWMRPLSGNRLLTLNENFPHVYALRERARGEAELRIQCNKAPKEESFVFVEGTGIDGRPLSIWVENGIKENASYCDSLLNKTLLEGLLSKFKSIRGLSMYHYHPKHGDKKYGSEYPSPTDLVTAINTAIDTLGNKYAFLDGVQDRRVVTEIGTFIIKPKYEAVRADVSGARRASDNFGRDRKLFFDDIKGKKLSSAERCNRFAQMHTSKYLELRFEPSK